MNALSVAHCTYFKADHWGMAAKSCLTALQAAQDNLVILYVTSGLAADLPSMLTFLRGARTDTQWQAAAVPALLCQDWFSDHSQAVAMLSLSLPKGSFRSTIETLPGWNTAGGTVQMTPPLQTHTTVTQCWVPMAPPHQINDRWQGTIMSLDGRPALSVFKDDMGVLLSRDLRRAEGYIHAGLTGDGADDTSFRVCAKLACDERHGWLITDPAPQDGQRLVVLRRDQNRVPEQLAAMTDQARQQAAGRSILAAHYLSCPSRHDWVWGNRSRDHSILREILGDIPLIGALSNQLPMGQGQLTLISQDD